MSRVRTLVLAVPAVLLLVSACGLFKGEGDSGYYYPAALLTGRMLISGNTTDDPLESLSLYTVDVGNSNSRLITYRQGPGEDYPCPDIWRDSNGQFNIIYGLDPMIFHHTVTGVSTIVAGAGGDRQIAASFDHVVPLRFAYMDGSATTGYDIVVQTGGDGTPLKVTNDASPTVSNWTPAWSEDGNWVLYAKVMGTTGADCELWRVHPDGTGAEQLPITTTEIPTYSVFSPDGTEVLVPGDFTSYKISDGTVGSLDAMRDLPKLLTDLAGMNLEFVGSALTGPVHAGETTSSFRHTFPISVDWRASKVYFDALVADTAGAAPHEIVGVAIFSWDMTLNRLKQQTRTMTIPEDRSEGYALSLMHPRIIVPD